MAKKITARQYAAKHRIPLTRLDSEEDGEGPDDLVTEASLRRREADMDAMDAADLSDAMGAVTYHEEELRAAKAGLTEAVRYALGEGYSATKAAKVLGVSRARVYQLRDGKR
jgi:hypothetical protein